MKTTKYNKSRICRRAYWLIHNEGLTQSEAMKQSWTEAKVVVLKSRATEQSNKRIQNHKIDSDAFSSYMSGVITEQNRILTL